MQGASLFVGNDSGPAHMAAAFGVPVVVLFGPSDPVTWAPWRTINQVVVNKTDIEANLLRRCNRGYRALEGPRMNDLRRLLRFVKALLVSSYAFRRPDGGCRRSARNDGGLGRSDL